MVTAAALKHIRHELRSYRGSTLVLLVLSCIWEKWQDGCDAFCACYLTCVDHDAELHQRGIDLAKASVDNVHVVFAYRLGDAYGGFAYAIPRHVRFGDGQSKSVRIESSMKRVIADIR